MIVTGEFVIFASLDVTMLDRVVVDVVEPPVKCLFVPYTVVPVIPPDLSSPFVLQSIEFERAPAVYETYEPA